jgi:hypothetical protein
VWLYRAAGGGGGQWKFSGKISVAEMARKPKRCSPSKILAFFGNFDFFHKNF